MNILLGSISSRRGGSSGPTANLFQLYLERAARYCPCLHRAFATEQKLLEYLDGSSNRTRPVLVLADSLGKQVSSEELASLLGVHQDRGVQQVVFAIGPADGWTSVARSRADSTIAFGRVTLPHELAAVILAEQVYRALTIRAGHPYHSGH